MTSNALTQEQFNGLVFEFEQTIGDREAMAHWLSHLSDREVEHGLDDGTLDAMDIDGESVWSNHDDEWCPDIYFELRAERAFRDLADAHGLTLQLAASPSVVPEWIDGALDATVRALLADDTTCAVSADCFDIIRKAEAFLDTLRDVDDAPDTLARMVAAQCNVSYYG